MVDEAEVADELFGAPRDEFVPIRSRRAAEAKADGDADLARRIAALRKPTVAAWLVNQLVRRYPEDVTDLERLATELADAHRHGSGDRLREAGQARRELLRRLEKRVRDVAGDTGVRLGDDAATQIATTFQVALINPAALRAVQGGRLSAAIGLDEEVLDQWPSADTRRPRPKPKPAPEPRESEPEPDSEPDPELVAEWEHAQELVREAAEARAEAERHLAKAQKVAARTETVLAEAKAAHDKARQNHQEARDAVEAARTALTSATNDEKAAERELRAHPDPRQRTN